MAHKNRKRKTVLKSNVFTLLALFAYLLIPIFAVGTDVAYLRDSCLVIALVFAAMAFQVKTPLKLRMHHLFAVSEMFVAITVSVLFIGSPISINGVISYMLFVGMYIWLTATPIMSEQFQTLNKIYRYIGLFISVCIILSAAFGRSYSWGRNSLDIIGIHRNPNYVTSHMMYPFALTCFDLQFTGRKGRKERILWLQAAVMVVACILSGTRATVLNTAAVFCLTFCAGMVLKKQYKKLAVIAGIAVAVAAVLPLLMAQDQLSRVLSAEELFNTSNRLRVWKAGFRAYSDGGPLTLLFGLGLERVNYATRLATTNNMHNLFLEILFDQGIVGLALFAGVLLSNSRMPSRFLGFLTAVMTIATMMPLAFQNGYISASFWLPIMMRRLFITQLQEAGAENWKELI